MRTRLVTARITAGLCLLFGFALATVACGGYHDNFVGTWQGTTSQGAQLTFQVQPQKSTTSAPTVFCFGFNVTDSQFRSLATECDPSALVFPVSGDHFSIDHRVNQVTLFTVSGRFTSSTSAMGDIVDKAGSTPVNLTWTATKQ